MKHFLDDLSLPVFVYPSRPPVEGDMVLVRHNNGVRQHDDLIGVVSTVIARPFLGLCILDHLQGFLFDLKELDVIDPEVLHRALIARHRREELINRIARPDGLRVTTLEEQSKLKDSFERSHFDEWHRITPYRKPD